MGRIRVTVNRSLQLVDLPDDVDTAMSSWTELFPELPTQGLLVHERLQLAAATLGEAIATIDRKYGLGVGGYDVLTALRFSAEPTRSPTSLALELELTTGQVTHRLDMLVSNRLVSREPSTVDRRAKSVRLLHKGREMVERVHAERVQAAERCVRRLDHRTRQVLARVLRVVADSAI